MPKRLVVCFDGTWNNADNAGGDTNVARIARAIHANVNTHGISQLVLYLRGVGTTGLDAERLIEGATGLGIDDNIRSGYMFLAQNYVPGDEIFLFGFSRGAFTARSLVGLMSAAGLLKRQSLGSLGEAWEYYRSPKPHSPALFAQRHSDVGTHLDVTIDFLGVWDTVGALGIPAHLFEPINGKLYGFYDTGMCPIVRKACHALAIDEHRDTFVPTLWTGDIPEGTSIEQVWFAGSHADVGGGYVTRHLADIPLVWMARRAEIAGLVLDWRCLPNAAQLDPTAPSHDSSSGIFAVSRFVPTLRSICGHRFDVPLFQRLYQPTDENHRPLTTVGESIHESVLARVGRDVLVSAADGGGLDLHAPYAPANLAALYDVDGSLTIDVTIVQS